MKIVGFSLEQGNKYFGRIDGARFFIGSRVPFEGGKGLMNIVGTAVQKYNRADFRSTYGFWADFIHPTAMAEGALYHTLNTYDRARFTFSFLQYAAHVPNGDFVTYVKALLQLPMASEYFPDLRIEDGRIVRIANEGIIILESDTSTERLLDYFNPSLREIEDTEVIQAAKLVHWAQNDPANRLAQVDIGIRHFQTKMVEYAARYALDGQPDTVCLVIADIRHQGRATSATILAALQSANPLKALLDIGEPRFHQRLLVLRREINRLIEEGILGTKKYSTAKKDFVNL
ncbi:hypothetical protein HNV11_06840 [Spirosoma taeanense]|uniref:Uncharacterized protein n=1 Tax=Spirosoma taeanense TaxID=2735870 RepID=A0A6M5Y6T7_9BACT|nr:hypothetical protein [Spirosoma taeanense]QJW89126.1 hypothetical protein HNV11_06840 [Spirosoma taeanense]